MKTVCEIDVDDPVKVEYFIEVETTIFFTMKRNFFSVNGGKTTSYIGLYLPFPAGIYLLQTSEKFMKLVQNQQQRHRNDTNSPITLMFLSLTLNKEMLAGVYMHVLYM